MVQTLLSIIGKQESNKPGNPSVSPTIDNHNKMISNEQKTLDNSMTSMSRTITHDDRLFIKPESATTPMDLAMNGTRDPFVLTLPTINDNLCHPRPHHLNYSQRAIQKRVMKVAHTVTRSD